MKLPNILTPLCIFALTFSSFAQKTIDDRDELLRKMDAQSQHYGDLSRRIWEFAEVGYKEKQSSELLKNELRNAGFKIQDNVGEIPTAFVASYGSGKPVIGIMGEYDALPGLSQEDIPEKKSRIAGAPGHGCGHNLFGAASAFAAITVKNYLTEKKLTGTIRFYGTPAEEGGGAKIYMARAGVFNDCDTVLVWHPDDKNMASTGTTLGNIAAKFKFYGKASHAAAAPDKGRSSLDAVMLMSHAVDMLREHVPQETRIHYVVTNGGSAPNIVPDFAEIYIYARQPSMVVVDDVWARIVKCAEAGALGTDTRMEMELINSVYNLLPNDALAGLYDKNLRRVGGLKYTAEEKLFAETIRKTLPVETALPLGSEAGIQPIESGLGIGSTDVADISWIVPTAQFSAATWVPGAPDRKSTRLNSSHRP